MRYIKNEKGKLFLLTTLVSLFVLAPYIFGSKEFVLGWDMQRQYSSLFELLRTTVQTAIRNRKPVFWVWESFLGKNFYSASLFYHHDIFDYIFCLTGLSYYKIALLQTYIKFMIAAFGMQAYARYHRFSETTGILSGLMFAFSSYQLQTMMHPFFASFTVFIPIYFLQIDRYIYEKKKIGYVLIVAFLLITNYYLFYSVSLFSVLYFISEYAKKNGTCKHFFRHALPLIGCYIIGFLLSGAVLIPEILYILGNSRLGHRSISLLYSSAVPYINIILSFLSPTSALSNRNSAISSLYESITTNESVLASFLWFSSIGVLLFPQALRKRKNRIETAIIGAFIFLPVLSSVMHGFSDPSFRWFICPVFFFLKLCLPEIEHPENLSVRLIKLTLILSGLITVFLPLALIVCVKPAAIKEYPLTLLTLPTLFISASRLMKRRNLLPVLITEVSIAALFSFYLNPAFSHMPKDTVQALSTVLGQKDDFNRFIYEQNPDSVNQFYRTFVHPDEIYWSFSNAQNMNFNIMGTMTYDSTFEPSNSDLNLLIPESGYLPWVFDLRDPYLMNLLSVKYGIVSNEDSVPFHQKQLIGTFNGFSVYENPEAIELGKTYSSLKTYEEYNGDTGLLQNTVFCNPEDYDEIRPLIGPEISEVRTVSKSINHLYADIEALSSGFLVLSVPYDKGWSVKVNGVPTGTYRVSGGLTGFAIPDGYSEITMHFTPPGLKTGILASGIGLGLLLLLLFRQKSRTGSSSDSVLPIE